MSQRTILTDANRRAVPKLLSVLLAIISASSALHAAWGGQNSSVAQSAKKLGLADVRVSPTVAAQDSAALAAQSGLTTFGTVPPASRVMPESVDHVLATTKENAPLGVNESSAQAKDEPEMEMMPVTAPFLVEDASTHNQLSVVISESTPTDIDISIYDLEGDVICSIPKTVPAHGDIVLQLRDELAQCRTGLPVRGSISISSKQPATIGAQLSITHEIPSSLRDADLEEEFPMPDPSLRNEFHALGLRVSEDPVIAFRSLSTTDQTVQLECMAEKVPAISRSFRLPAMTTVYRRGCSDRALTPGDDVMAENKGTDDSSKTVGFSVSSDTKVGELVVFGYVFRDDVFEPLEFQQADTIQPNSTVFPGVPHGSLPELGGARFEPELGIANFSNFVRSAQVFASEADHTNLRLLSRLTLGPRSSQRVPLRLESQDGLESSIVVITDSTDGKVVANLNSISAEMKSPSIEVPSKDGHKMSNAGQHPWSIANGNHSELILFNADETAPQTVDLQIYSDASRWESHMTLKAVETKVIDIGGLIQRGEKDIYGHTLPTNAHNGIVAWSSLGTTDVFGRMSVSNEYDGYARNFSCMGVVIICGAAIDGSNFIVGVGQTRRVTGAQKTCLSNSGCTCNKSAPACSESGSAGSNITYVWKTADPSIASVSPSTPPNLADLTGKGPGNTTLQLGVSGGASRSCSGSTSTGVMVCAALPVNFRQTSVQDVGGGDLRFTYAWDSSTGKLSDLSQCTLGEIVTYPGGSPYPWPSPPFPSGVSTSNPTIGNVSGSDGKFTDDHLLPSTSFPKPYANGTFTATQFYRYQCPCMSSYVDVAGPNFIKRSVYSSGQAWYYSVTKSGATAVYGPLP